MRKNWKCILHYLFITNIGIISILGLNHNANIIGIAWCSCAIEHRVTNVGDVRVNVECTCNYISVNEVVKYVLKSAVNNELVNPILFRGTENFAL